jgi:hypothetical protein
MQLLICRTQYRDYDGTLAWHPGMSPFGLVVSVISAETASSETATSENTITGLEYIPQIPDSVRIHTREAYVSIIADVVFKMAIGFTAVGETNEQIVDGRRM